jgi:Tol biopolymer transport system component
LATGEWLEAFRPLSPFSSFAISPNGRFLVGQGDSFFGSGITVWDGKTRTNAVVISNTRNAFDHRFYGSLLVFRNFGSSPTGGITEQFVGYSLTTGKTNFSITTKRGYPFWGVDSQAALSENGRFVVFCDDANGRVPGDNNGVADIVAYDVARRVFTLVSANRADGGPGNGASTFPWISQNGRFVAFLSRATNLTADDTHGKQQVFVRDLWLGKTTLVSWNLAGDGGGNADAPSAVLSPSGRHVAYTSFATDIVPGDFNGHADIFLAELPDVPLVDTDGDGMDDVWERYFFGDISRDGKGDLDGDGYSDLEEYVLNLDPGQPTVLDADEDDLEDGWERRFFGTLDRDGTGDWDGDGVADAVEYRFGSNPLSYDPVIILSTRKVTERELRITWRAIPGARYQVQYKSSLSQQEWSNIGDVITAERNEAAYPAVLGPTVLQRFYRITVVP